jgi:Na+/alanine symporter
MSDMTPLAQAILVYAVMALGVLATLLTGIAQLQAFRGSQGDRAALAGRRGLLAASTGMGSISGALLALEIGGPGAIGWMWIASLLGMGVVYAEVLLAVRHRARAASGRGLEAASTHVLAQVGGRPLALIVVVALVAVCAALVPVFGTLSTDMMIIGGLGVAVLVGLGVVAIKGLWRSDSGKPHAMLYGLVVMVFALAAGSLLQTQQAGELLASLGGDRWLTVGVLVLAATAGLALPKLRGFVIALAPVAVGLYAIATLWIVLRSSGDVAGALNLIALGIAGMDTQGLVGGAAGGGVLLAMQTGFLRATLASEAGLGSAGFMHELDRARSPERAAASAMLAPLIAGVLVPTLTALVAMTATPWVGQRIDEPAERRPSADQREAGPAELDELAAALSEGRVDALRADDRKRVVAQWAPLELPQSRGTAASLQTGQTVVLPEDAGIDADAPADAPGLRRDWVYPMVMRGSPRGMKVPLAPDTNEILMTSSPETDVVRELVFRDRDTERAQYHAYDLRVAVDNEPVERNGVAGRRLTPSDPNVDLQMLARHYDGPYMVFGDYYFQGRVVRMFQSDWGLHDAVVEAVQKGRTQLSLRTTIPTSSWRGPYLDEGEPRPPVAMLAKQGFDAPVGARLELAYRSPERGLDVGFMQANGELQTPPWRFLTRTTHAVLRHVSDPSKDLRVKVDMRVSGGTLRFRSAQPEIVDFSTWERWAEYEGPYLDAPDYAFEAEVHTGTRFPASTAYLQRSGEARKSLVGAFAERRTLVAVHPDLEPRGPAGELYDPHPAEVAPFMVGPYVSGSGVERLGFATKITSTRGADLLLAVAVLLLALTTMITWGGDGARAAGQVFGRGAGLGFALVFLLVGLGGAALELRPILRLVDHLMIPLVVLHGSGLVVLLVRGRAKG